MKKHLSPFSTIILFLSALSLAGQNSSNQSANNTAQQFNLLGGYGTHGIVFGLNARIATTMNDNSGTRLYLDVGTQGISFDEPVIFMGAPYNSDSRIISFDGGIAQEFYVSPNIHLAPFIGIRFENTHFNDSYISEKIGDGQLIRLSDGFEVGSRLSKDYGVSNITIDIGGSVNFRIVSCIWFAGKIAVCPIKYDNDGSIYGKYWANTTHKNTFAINRSILRIEGTLNFGF